MGQCMPCIKQNASKIRIRRMQLDKNLNMVGRRMFPTSTIFTKAICVSLLVL